MVECFDLWAESAGQWGCSKVRQMGCGVFLGAKLVVNSLNLLSIVCWVPDCAHGLLKCT